MRRREFVSRLAMVAGGLAAGSRWLTDARRALADTTSNASPGAIAQRPFGRTGATVSLLGLGGHALGQIASEGEAVAVVRAALDAGVTFMDNAWEYHDGRSEEWMGAGLAGRRDEAFLMTKVCTHGRGAKTAMEQLEQSLRRLRTDHVDLWQVHEVIYDNDPALHFRPDGVMEVLSRAKRDGKTRFVGFTGHKSPSIHLKMLSYDYPFDACQLPLNPFDGTFRSFETEVLPILVQRGIAPIAMKSLGGTGAAVQQHVLTAEEALRYVMSLPIATLVSGITSADILQSNVDIARRFTPMSAEQQQALRTRCAAYAADGRYELYKTSMRFDGPPGREQHGFPSQEQVPT